MEPAQAVPPQLAILIGDCIVGNKIIHINGIHVLSSILTQFRPKPRDSLFAIDFGTKYP